MEDDACPSPGSQIVSFNMFVLGVDIIAPDTTICPGIAQSFTIDGNGSSNAGTLPGSYQWSQLAGTPITFSSTTVAQPVITTLPNTVDNDSIVLRTEYTIQTSLGPCVTADTITLRFKTLPLNVDILTPDSILCPTNQLQTINLTTAVDGPGVDLVNGVYNWTAIPAAAISDLSATNINNPTASRLGVPNDAVSYTVSYTYGLCYGEILLIYKVAILLQALMLLRRQSVLDTVALSSSIVDSNSCQTDYTISGISFALLYRSSEWPCNDDAC